MQFSALTYRLGDNSGFLAFRGTDGTVVGWKEDFNLSFMQQTAGQERAIDYLNAAFENDDQPIRLGGHSKGGNFAIFSSLYCNESATQILRSLMVQQTVTMLLTMMITS